MRYQGGMSGMIEQEEINRMQWAARRGMLELDLVLAPFVRGRYPHLTASERAVFQQLMLCEDQDLFAWFLQRQRPDEQELADLVDQILEFASNATDSR
jgi:antitoxin CptB